MLELVGMHIDMCPHYSYESIRVSGYGHKVHRRVKQQLVRSKYTSLQSKSDDARALCYLQYVLAVRVKAAI